jgi:hypothetical protein
MPLHDASMATVFSSLITKHASLALATISQLHRVEFRRCYRHEQDLGLSGIVPWPSSCETMCNARIDSRNMIFPDIFSQHAEIYSLKISSLVGNSLRRKATKYPSLDS